MMCVKHVNSFYVIKINGILSCHIFCKLPVVYGICVITQQVFY